MNFEIDTSKPYDPSGLAMPLEGDRVVVTVQFPLRPPPWDHTQWLGKIEDTLDCFLRDTLLDLKLKKHDPIPIEHVVKIEAA